MDAAVDLIESALVSVIMPAYNAAAHLAATIESVQSQTYPHWELVIVDDGSTDDTRNIVQRYAAHDERIRYIYQSNARQGRARNNGLKHATGRYIAFLDADDLWLPHKLAVQVPFLEESGADLIFSDTYVFEHQHELTANSERMHVPAQAYAGPAGLELFLAHNRIPILTVLCKRQVLEAVGGFTENQLIQNAEDYHLWLKLLLQDYQLLGTSQVLAAYRVHSNSVSGTDRQNLRQVVEAKADLLATYPSHHKVLSFALKQAILHSMGYLSALPLEAFFAALYRFLQVSGKAAWQPLFALMHKTGARHLALRGAYFTFNHL
ncbi:hypothetical protein GCM10027422_29910 [Hymenobacter arcticus]